MAGCWDLPLKEAMLNEPVPGGVLCNLCAHRCAIQDEGVGFCRVRKNVGGKLFTNVYGEASIDYVDPIEKKSLFHFKGGGEPEFYRTFCEVPDVNPIFECLRELKRHKVHVEITNLVVPEYGDSVGSLRKLAV